MGKRRTVTEAKDTAPVEVVVEPVEVVEETVAAEAAVTEEVTEQAPANVELTLEDLPIRTVEARAESFIKVHVKVPEGQVVAILNDGAGDLYVQDMDGNPVMCLGKPYLEENSAGIYMDTDFILFAPSRPRYTLTYMSRNASIFKKK